MDATFERRNTTVDIPLLSEGGGTPLVARDLGKPNLRIQESGRVDPRSSDQWSGLENFQIFGQFESTDDSAYSDAITLCDLIKSASGSASTLNIPKSEYDSDISVVPLAEQEQACSITYPPGRRRWVEVQLGLTRVSTVNGSGESYSSPTNTTGTGPIQITDGTDVVDLTTDIEVERTVGRPNSTVRRTPSQYPAYTEKRKAAFDEFSLSLEFVENTTTKTDDLIDMFNSQLGRSTLTLDFNGLYNYGKFDVVPSGSRAIRQAEPAGQESVELIPEINLRVVDNS